MRTNHAWVSTMPRRRVQTPERPAWMDEGNCAAIGASAVALFYSLDPVTIDRAKAVCSGCPVRQDCLDYALEHNELGVWGGVGERERRTMKRRLQRERTKRAAIPW